MNRGGDSIRARTLLARYSLVTSACAHILLSPLELSAWNNQTGHRHIIEKAVEIIERDFPGQYSEVTSPLKYSKDIANGADIEDVPDRAVLRHFHNPVTARKQQGLAVHFELDGVGVSPFPLTLGPFPFLPSVVESAVDRSVGLLGESIRQYSRERNRAAAYTTLGRIAHLTTQDLYQPQHTHDDAHLPFAPGKSTIELRFDERLNEFSITGLSPTLMGPPPLDASDVRQFGDRSSRTAYSISRYPGSMVNTGPIDLRCSPFFGQYWA